MPGMNDPMREDRRKTSGLIDANYTGGVDGPHPILDFLGGVLGGRHYANLRDKEEKHKRDQREILRQEEREELERIRNDSIELAQMLGPVVYNTGGGKPGEAQLPSPMGLPGGAKPPSVSTGLPEAPDEVVSFMETMMEVMQIPEDKRPQILKMARADAMARQAAYDSGLQRDIHTEVETERGTHTGLEDIRADQRAEKTEQYAEERRISTDEQIRGHQANRRFDISNPLPSRGGGGSGGGGTGAGPKGERYWGPGRAFPTQTLMDRNAQTTARYMVQQHLKAKDANVDNNLQQVITNLESKGPNQISPWEQSLLSSIKGLLSDQQEGKGDESDSFFGDPGSEGGSTALGDIKAKNLADEAKRARRKLVSNGIPPAKAEEMTDQQAVNIAKDMGL